MIDLKGTVVSKATSIALISKTGESGYFVLFSPLSIPFSSVLKPVLVPPLFDFIRCH